MPRIERIDTGQVMPEGIDTLEAVCVQCERSGPCAELQLAMPDGTAMGKVVCAECLADFVSGAPFLGARVYGKRGGIWAALGEGEVYSDVPKRVLFVRRALSRLRPRQLADVVLAAMAVGAFDAKAHDRDELAFVVAGLMDALEALADALEAEKEAER